ncbi:TPA: CDP-archaeol synthase [Candidatus Micrarchaeota archaeon]|nr:CDP-archaeol synthase [Candidatus Micrarchaeota archaeon]
MIVETLALLSPAYFSSPFATLSCLLPRRHPVDFNIRLRDGNRLLGDGKTWEGLLLGTLLGGVAGALVYIPFGISENPFLMAFLGLLGDMMGSFAKRRMGLERGEHAPLLDELDFLAPPLMYALPPAADVAVILVVTPFLHRLASAAGYAAGVKREPW